MVLDYFIYTDNTHQSDMVLTVPTICIYSNSFAVLINSELHSQDNVIPFTYHNIVCIDHLFGSPSPNTAGDLAHGLV